MPLNRTAVFHCLHISAKFCGVCWFDYLWFNHSQRPSAFINTPRSTRSMFGEFEFGISYTYVDGFSFHLYIPRCVCGEMVVWTVLWQWRTLLVMQELLQSTVLDHSKIGRKRIWSWVSYDVFKNRGVMTWTPPIEHTDDRIILALAYISYISEVHKAIRGRARLGCFLAGIDEH